MTISSPSPFHRSLLSLPPYATAMFAPFPTAALTALALSVFAAASPSLPRSLDAIPREATKLAYDPETGIVSAFDKRGAFLGRTPYVDRALEKRAGSCVDLSADDVKNLAGWDALAQKAKDNWGGGSYNLATNIDDENGYPAQACTSNNAAKVELSGDTSCTTKTQVSEGTIVGSNGTITLSTTIGTEMSTTITATKSAAIGLGASVSATIGIPDVVDVTSEISTSVTVTNELSNAVTTSTNSQQTSTIAMSAKAGETCSLTFTNKACTASGKGKINIIATGWAWFQYEDKVDGHYYWALNMDDVLSESDRTSSMEFSAAISGTNLANYKGSCSA
ncbi:hypothetical protein MKEN_00444300 [Mycena kentingensis (nom. inval.)]|nr:hypothetical protein MKEN_00444300 [Mycena kentingensis (nom. inval.)]